jgi:uncharacterized protein YfeS
MKYDDHDPWNEPSQRHPRARDLMREETFWDCVNELAPFGSDEGADAYVEYRDWRAENPESNLIECIVWILDGRIDEYNVSLTEVSSISESDESAETLGYPNAFTLDATIIATVLGQLVDEGRIDIEAKPYAAIAIRRQNHPLVLSEYDDDAAAERRAILEITQRVIDEA